METSNEFYVTDAGLVRIVMDNHTGEEIIISVYGVHRLGMMWIWNPTRGPAKSVTDEWLRTEDGMDFKDFMDRHVDGFDTTDFNPEDDEE